MKIAIIGASGKTGTRLVAGALGRGHEAVAVCREKSVAKLDEFSGKNGFTAVAAPAPSDEATLTRALQGCDAAVAIPVSIGKMRATDLVQSLIQASAVNGVRRFAFTAGEVTAVKDDNETYTLRQKIMIPAFSFILWPTPISLTDMRKATALIKQQSDWEWSIVRAPTLTDRDAVGYRYCELSDITSRDKLSRIDYATCLLDCIDQNRTGILTVTSADP